jgi:hypothetical protein
MEVFSLEALQFRVLPFGSLLLLAVIGAMWALRKRMSLRARSVVLLSGLAGGAALAVALVSAYRLPWLSACLNCVTNSPWFSVALTMCQGWGFVSAVALVMWHWRARNSMASGSPNAA